MQRPRLAEALRRVILAGLMLYIFIIVAVFTTMTQDNTIIKNTLGHTLLALLTALWGIRLLAENRLRLRRGEHNWPLLAMLLLLVLSLLRSPAVGISFPLAAQWLACLLTVWLIADNVERRAEFVALAAALAAATAWGLGYAAVQAAGYDPIDWGWSIVTSSFGGCPNTFPQYLAVVMAVLLGMLCASRLWRWRLPLLLIYGAGLWGLYQGHSRSAAAAWVVSLVVMMGMTMLRPGLGGRLRRMELSAWLAILVALGLVVGCLGLLPEPVTNRLNPLPYASAASPLRQELLLKSLAMWKAAPVLGHGVGAFQIVFPLFRSPEYHHFNLSHTTADPDNEYLRLLAEQGALGLLAFGWFWMVVLFLLWRAIRCTELAWWRETLAGCAAGGMAYLALIALPACTHTAPAHILIAYVIAGLALAGSRLATTEESVAPASVAEPLAAPRRVFAAAAMFAVVVSGIAIGEWRMLYGNYLLTRAEVTLRAMNRESYVAAIPVFRAVLDCNPWDLSVYYKVAFCELQDSRTLAAAQTYKQLTSIASHYAQVHYNLAMTYEAMNWRFQALEQRMLAAAMETNHHNHSLAGNSAMTSSEYRRAAGQFQQSRNFCLADRERTMEYFNRQENRFRDSQQEQLQIAKPLQELVQSDTSAALAWRETGDNRLAAYHACRARFWQFPLRSLKADLPAIQHGYITRGVGFVQ